MKIVTVLGARPQFIKAVMVSRHLSLHSQVEEVIVHTGQHFDNNMSEVFFEEMQIPRPRYNLKINSLTHGAMTGRMMEAIEKVLIKEKPDYTLVYGDTNSTLSGALVAQKMNIPVIHIEAGLRSFNMRMPEEVNRILTDRISTLLFCPTKIAVENLEREGYSQFNCTIINSGDVMQDAAMHYAQQMSSDENFLEQNNLRSGEYILATVHRQENTDVKENLESIFSALDKLNSIKQVVLPLHPRTKNKLQHFNIRPKVRIIPPQGYFNMIRLIRNASVIMTDSGGLQKEAYFFKKFCITLREETEWLELVMNGYNRIVGADPEKIYQAYEYFSQRKFNNKQELYGGGKASSIIMKHIIEHYKSI